eukprot:TRINITY_DN7892_c1_g1_i1.p1 TRINITY_DN7892_c1_g1~~TRINITY_DN7892_c1_g1_i1.p1  ORF type:complete len:123 (-),score=15.86 TRINITY_DN7892_c1_g1_i1:142-510(-)
MMISLSASITLAYPATAPSVLQNPFLPVPIKTSLPSWGLRWSLVVAGGSRPRMRSGDEVWGAEGEERMHEEERNRFCVDTEMGAFLGILLRKIEIFKGSRYCQIPTFSFHINFFETVHTFVK